MNPESRACLIRNPDVVVKEEDSDGALVFNPDNDKILVLNPTGFFIWQQCDGRNTLVDIVSAVQENFAAVPQDRASKETQAFLDGLVEGGFIGTLDETREED